jgi:hypothetical protein
LIRAIRERERKEKWTELDPGHKREREKRSGLSLTWAIKIKEEKRTERDSGHKKEREKRTEHDPCREETDKGNILMVASWQHMWKL